MKKVLIVNNLLGYHGAENVLRNFANHLDKKYMMSQYLLYRNRLENC